jgi:ABC-type transport system involved in cytochrome c biogenesis permease subunit
MKRIIATALLLMVATLARAAEPTLDLVAWRHIPVLHNGRVMPLDTFARNATEIICDRVNPTLSLAGISEEQLASEEFAGARVLFPDGKSRRFSAAELLLSWLVEPEKWEQVPFLIAEHDELRKLLDIPVTAPDGTHLKYVSPAVVADSQKFRERLEQMSEAQRAASMENAQPASSSLDKSSKELFEAFTLYRQITFNPQKHEGARSRFLKTAAEVLKGWAKLDEELLVLRARPEFNERIERTDAALKALVNAAGTGRFELETVEPSVVVAVDGLKQLSADCTQLKTHLFKAKVGEVAGFDQAQLDTAKARINRLAAAMRLLARQANEMHIALYDNGDALRVVPALNVAALDKDRDVSDESQPWLTLQTVLTGSPEVLKDYPQPLISAVRATFSRLVTAYVNRKATDRQASVVKADDEFAVALRQLGDKTSSMRDKLEISGRDEALMQYTAYPAPGATDAEVRYNRVDPFKWSWVISLLALVSFALAFGVARKPMFWLGTLLLVGGLLWTAHGFYMRVLITHWAPVTNMYETVVYVPFFVSLLGAWFLLLPVTWPGLERAWRMSAIPGTWEATLDDGDVSRRSHFGLLNIALLLARAGLMVLVLQIVAFRPYAAGGRTIINLLPVVDVGSSLPTINNLVVWIVGLCVLLPAVWVLPRVLVTLAVGLFTVTKTLFEQGRVLTNEVYVRKPFGLAATFAAFLGSFIAWYSPVLDKNFTPLQPVLRDNFWLTIHVLTIVSSYGAGMLAWGLGNLSLGYYLFGKYRSHEPTAPSELAAGYRPARTAIEFEPAAEPVRVPPEECHTLAGFIYKTIQVAVLLLATGTILGGLWAAVSWGRFWGWDPKEVWALISLLTYLAILHGRYAGWFGDFGLAAGSVMGATAIVMSWYGVNFVLGAGLHSYGFGAGGQAEVGAGVLANWLFLGAAGLRYRWETRERNTPTKPPTVERQTAQV